MLSGLVTRMPAAGEQRYCSVSLTMEAPQQPCVDVWRRTAGQVLQGRLKMEQRGLAWSGLPRSEEAD